MKKEVLTNEGIKIFPFLKNFKNFYLSGGTALALQLGHRVSIDFDLFYDKDIPKNLFDKVKKIFTKHQISPSVNSPDELTIFIDNVKVTFLKYPFPVLYKFNSYQGVNLLNIKDLAATKAYTIGRRGSYKDYIDLYFLILEKYISLEQIIDISKKKYKNLFNTRLFLEQLVYMKDIDDIDIIFLQKKTTLQEVEKFFIKEVKNISL
ncbi:nucleotidyl transferase AbiEii/AbiGii toxin family protein [Patescibacteria group bacterium]